MDINSATRALSALSQPTRLETFRLLVRSGPEGMPAGEVARRLDVPHNTMSSHLSILANAGLVGSRREGRSVIYGVEFDGVRKLLGFLVEDCCQGTPDVCGPILDSVLNACCG
jgi:ArsR family transcriptional regulator, arsenate/arsenite/antimonite-responsive transcriptional repressor